MCRWMELDEARESADAVYYVVLLGASCVLDRLKN